MNMEGRNGGQNVLVEVDANGHLILSELPAGANDIGQILNGFQEVEVLSNTARTTNGQSNIINVGKYKEAVAFLKVTDVGGTSPTLDVKFQTQDPVSGEWFDITDLTFSQATVATSEMKSVANLLGSKIRCDYAIGGTTPSFTFSVGLILKS